MANTVYVNVGGTWKTVSNYYVNVSGVWKAGTEFANNVSGIWKGVTGAASSADLPTALQICGLEYAEFMCLPHVYVESKQGLNADSLDYPEWQTLPLYARDSVFVYTAPPASGPSTLPTSANIQTLDYPEWQTMPNVHLSVSGSARMDDLEVAEFMCLPYWGVTPDYIPATTEFPSAANVANLEYAEFMCLPQVHIGSKSTVNNTTLDYPEWQTLPMYSRTSAFVYTAPPAPGPSTLPTSANLKTLEYPEWQTMPIVHVSAKSAASNEGLDLAEFMCLPTYTTF